MNLGDFIEGESKKNERKAYEEKGSFGLSLHLVLEVPPCQDSDEGPLNRGEPSANAGFFAQVKDATEEVSKMLVPVDDNHPEKEEEVTQEEKKDAFGDGGGSEHQDP